MSKIDYPQMFEQNFNADKNQHDTARNFGFFPVYDPEFVSDNHTEKR